MINLYFINTWKWIMLWWIFFMRNQVVRHNNHCNYNCERDTGIFRRIFRLDSELTHWGQVTHICVSDLTIIGSDNGLSAARCQAIIRTNAGILLIRSLGTNFSEFLIEILISSFMKMRLKVSSVKRRQFCLGLNELRTLAGDDHSGVSACIFCDIMQISFCYRNRFSN